MVLDDEVVNAYIEKTASLAKEPKSDINYVYTAMHGVGYEVLSKNLNQSRSSTTSYRGRTSMARWHIPNGKLP